MSDELTEALSLHEQRRAALQQRLLDWRTLSAELPAQLEAVARDLESNFYVSLHAEPPSKLLFKHVPGVIRAGSVSLTQSDAGLVQAVFEADAKTELLHEFEPSAFNAPVLRRVVGIAMLRLMD